MITVFPYEKLGNQDHGWLHAHYHFNFANYHDENKNGFPPLLVWNDDVIKPGTGFPMHSHRDMEIITCILEGAITHEDNFGNKGVTRKGEMQIMSAGTGITHSEYNHEDIETHLFQIWLEPSELNITPRWENIDIDLKYNNGIFPIASGEKKFKDSKILNIYQEATLYIAKGCVNDSFKYDLEFKRHIYFVVSKGSVRINDIQVDLQDGVRVIEEQEIEFIFQGDSELIILDLPIIT